MNFVSKSALLTPAPFLKNFLENIRLSLPKKHDGNLLFFTIRPTSWWYYIDQMIGYFDNLVLGIAGLLSHRFVLKGKACRLNAV